MPPLAITVKIITILDKFADDLLFFFVELAEHCFSPYELLLVNCFSTTNTVKTTDNPLTFHEEFQNNSGIRRKSIWHKDLEFS